MEKTRFKLKYTITVGFTRSPMASRGPGVYVFFGAKYPSSCARTSARRRTSSRRIDWRVLGAGTRGSAAAALMRFRTAVNRIP